MLRENVLKVENFKVENKNLKVAARLIQEDTDKNGKEKQEYTAVTQRGKTASKRHNASTSYLTKNQYEVFSDSGLEKEVKLPVSQKAVSTQQTNQHKVTVRDAN